MHVKLRERAIREYTGEQNFSLGREYIQRGAVFDTKQQGELLKARCEGSREEPYRLSVRLQSSGSIVESSCSCPMQQRCKHIAALLLLWRLHPEDFVALETIEDVLEKKSREELSALIQKMLSRSPELEVLFEVPKVNDSAAQGERVMRESYRKQAAAIFRRCAGKSNAQEALVEALQDLMGIAKEKLSQKDALGAASIYIPLLQELFTEQEDSLDEGGPLAELAVECSERLGESLLTLPHDDTRRAALGVLFEVYQFDIEAGGVTLGDQLPSVFVRVAREEERAMLAAELRAVLSHAETWGKKQYSALLLDLQRGRASDGELLQLCQDAGRFYDLAECLLRLQRPEEIVELAAAASTDELLRIANLLRDNQKNPIAQELIHKRSIERPDPQLSSWLNETQDQTVRLQRALEDFKRGPTLQRYHLLRQIATELNQWPSLAVSLYDSLRGAHKDLLRQIFIEEGRFSEAFLLLPPMESSDFLDCYPHLLTAEAAESSRPELSIEIYQRYIELQLGLAGLTAAREACRFLSRLQKLLPQDQWSRYLSLLREKNANNNALQLELQESGLTTL